MQEYDVKLGKKLEAEYQKKMDNSSMIKTQLEEFKNKHVQALQDEFLEGQLLKKQVEDDIEAERQKEIERQLKNRQLQEEQLQANRDHEEYLRQLREKEKLEEKEIEKFAKKKERLDQMRKEKEADKMKQKQDEKQRLIDRQIAYLQNKQNRDDEILGNQIREAELRAEKEFRAKEAKRKQMEDVSNLCSSN